MASAVVNSVPLCIPVPDVGAHSLLSLGITWGWLDPVALGLPLLGCRAYLGSGSIKLSKRKTRIDLNAAWNTLRHTFATRLPDLNGLDVAPGRQEMASPPLSSILAHFRPIFKVAWIGASHWALSQPYPPLGRACHPADVVPRVPGPLAKQLPRLQPLCALLSPVLGLFTLQSSHMATWPRPSIVITAAQGPWYT